MYKEEIYNVALSSDDNKRLQTFDRITTFVQKTPHVKECENEMVSVRKGKETLKILRKDCESKLYATCNIFLNYMKTKCGREMKKYVKFGAKKNAKLLFKV